MPSFCSEAAGFGNQQRADARLEVARVGHSGRARPRPPAGGQAASQIQQVGGIFVRRDARRQHGVIARALAFVPQAAGRDPPERLKPVETTGDLCQRLR